MATIFKLIIEDDEGKTTVYPLADGEISIGRKEGNTIRLMERNVSRRHARLVRNNGAVFIEDLDSYNGIKINGERIAGRYEVKEGDLVEIGDYHLALQQTEVEQEANGGRPAGGWPQGGTVPDFELPDEVLAGGSRDTIIDQPGPDGIPSAVAQTLRPGVEIPGQPLVKPPPKNPGGELPPFPTSGGGGALPPPQTPLYSDAADTEAGKPSEPRALASGPAVVSQVPRLVCVSTSYAGKEFALTRPELIIGRVEDNDIVIEHRSVSRNHAKILFDGRTHKIIDLQSANGILVNGEEYAMTDLRKGDLIELGHVRFRFIPADEVFLPTDEEAEQMREAGVEPPKPAAPGFVDRPKAQIDALPGTDGSAAPVYDPSTAATVTDTPLDVFGLEKNMMPSQVAVNPAPARPKNPPAPEPVRPAAEEVPVRALEVSPPAPPPPKASPPASTPRPNATPKPSRSRASSDSLDQTNPIERVPPPRPSGRDSKTAYAVAAAVLLVLVGVLAFLLISGPSDSSDKSEMAEKLENILEKEGLGGVKKFCEDNKAQLAKEAAVWNKYCAAFFSKANPSEPPPSEPEPLPVGDPPEPETEVEDTALAKAEPKNDVRTDSPEEPTKRRRKRRPRKEDPQKLAVEANRFLITGAFSKAEDLLKKCTRADPKFADCHRSLGVLYAQKNETKRSIRHYRKYLDLRPDADDADKVRKMLAEATGDSP